METLAVSFELEFRNKSLTKKDINKLKKEIKSIVRYGLHRQIAVYYEDVECLFGSKVKNIKIW